METIRQGSTGDAVKVWQKVIGVPEDGIFGKATNAATRAWQAAHSLIPDGIVGPASWSASTGILARPTDGRLAIKGTDLAFPIQGELKESVWKALAEAGFRFAIMRLQVGNEKWSDVAQVKRQLEIARAFGIACSAYFFSFPLPHLSPALQVENFVRLLEQLGNLGSNVGDLPPAHDMEWPPPEEWKTDPDPSTDVWPDGSKKRRNAQGQVLVDLWKKWGCTPDQICDWFEAATERGEELTGGLWLLYGYRYFFRRIGIAKRPFFAKRPLWLADYKFQSRWVTRSEIATVSPEPPWDKNTIIQFDGNGGLKLPNGVDADFNMFVGNEEDFDALVGRRDVPVQTPEIDLTMARQEVREAIVDEEIAAYRRRRIDEELERA